jgi:hypothetical protein
MPGSFLNKREEPGNEVGVEPDPDSGGTQGVQVRAVL